MHPGPGVLRGGRAVDGPAPGGQEATRATRRRRRRRKRVLDGYDETFAGGKAAEGDGSRDTAVDDEGDRAGAAASARVASVVGGGLPEGDAIVALRRLAEALAHLHERGFVHRDVKLENLLLGSPGDLRTLKLADFGFATAASDRDGCRSRAFLAKDLTGDRLQGTVEYAAPEVLADIGMTAPGKNGELGMLTDNRGRRLRPDRPSNTRPEVDLWSAGVTAFIVLGVITCSTRARSRWGFAGAWTSPCRGSTRNRCGATSPRRQSE